jgi:RNA-directed DNA polymerase
MQSKSKLTGSPSLLPHICSLPFLHAAWRKVRANRGAAGIDAVSIRAFERNLAPNLKELSRNLLEKSYEPLPARHVCVLKPDGRQREIAILTVRDRVAQRAVLDAIEPMFEPRFLDCSFAFRSERSVEMAIQRLVVARAQGFVWTVDADLENFFGTLDHQLLLDDLSATLEDEDVLQLIKQWLDAGTLDGGRPTLDWIRRWQSSIAGMNLVVRDAVTQRLDRFVFDRLGVDPLSQPDQTDWSAQSEAEPAHAVSHASELRRAAMDRLLQDGLLLAVAERAALRGLLSLKTLGIGGAALGLIAAAPFALKKLEQLKSPRGTLQGAPLSPLLSNVYLHSFDVVMNRPQHRLVRYCDDFVILCRSEAEARAALREAESTLRERRLRLSSHKTRIVSPLEPFRFLGHTFTPDGRVVPPPSLPDVVTRRIAEFARRHRRDSAARIKAATLDATSLLDRVKNVVLRR